MVCLLRHGSPLPMLEYLEARVSTARSSPTGLSVLTPTHPTKRAICTVSQHRPSSGCFDAALLGIKSSTRRRARISLSLLTLFSPLHHCLPTSPGPPPFLQAHVISGLRDVAVHPRQEPPPCALPRQPKDPDPYSPDPTSRAFLSREYQRRKRISYAEFAAWAAHLNINKADGHFFPLHCPVRRSRPARGPPRKKKRTGQNSVATNRSRHVGTACPGHWRAKQARASKEQAGQAD